MMKDTRPLRLRVKRFPWRAGWYVLALLFSSAAFAEEEAEDSETRAERVLRLVQSQIASASARGPSVLGDIEVRSASPSVRKAFRRLRGTKANFSLQKQPLAAVLELFQSLAGVPFIMSAKARKACHDEDLEVTLSLTRISLENALNLLMLQLDGFRFVVSYGAVVLIRREEYKPRKVLRTYLIHDLVHVPPDFPAPQLALEPRE